jgi:hypothetical protein
VVLFIYEEKEHILRCLKGQSHGILNFRFSLISYPQASDYSLSTFSHSFETGGKLDCGVETVVISMVLFLTSAVDLPQLILSEVGIDSRIQD